MGLAAWEGRSGFGGGGTWVSLASLMWFALFSLTPVSASLLHFHVCLHHFCWVRGCFSLGLSRVHHPTGVCCALGVEGRQSCCEGLRSRARIHGKLCSCLCCQHDTDHPHFLPGNVPGDLFSVKVSRSPGFKRSHSLNNASSFSTCRSQILSSSIHLKNG